MTSWLTAGAFFRTPLEMCGFHWEGGGLAGCNNVGGLCRALSLGRAVNYCFCHITYFTLPYMYDVHPVPYTFVTQMYEATLMELQEANAINANSRSLLSQLEENFSAASTQYEATLEVSHSHWSSCCCRPM